jgi:hypothetical protein
MNQGHNRRTGLDSAERPGCVWAADPPGCKEHVRGPMPSTALMCMNNLSHNVMAPPTHPARARLVLLGRLPGWGFLPNATKRYIPEVVREKSIDGQ